MYRQATLSGDLPVAGDASFAALTRRMLDATSWLDVAPGWLSGADELYDQLVASLPWRQHEVTMYGRRLPEPRLSAWWRPADGAVPLPVLGQILSVLGARYAVVFDSIGFNWYRDGADSVAWHADTKGPPLVEPTIAIVAVGARRPFRLRRRGGGAAVTINSGAGDLLVMGGRCQHDWEHTVPKVRGGGPRISITFRHDGNH